MSIILQLAILSVLLIGCVFLFVHAHMAFKKSKVGAGINIQCSSGDSEVMSFNYNFIEGESQESKDSKIAEAFQYIQDRRDENHEKYLKIKADAIAENEAKLAAGESLKLKSVSQTESRTK